MVRLPRGPGVFAGSLEDAASGASRRACIYYTRMQTVRFPTSTFVEVASSCLSWEHSHRRRLPGSGALVAQGRCPRAVISGGTHRHVDRSLCRRQEGVKTPSAFVGPVVKPTHLRLGVTLGRN